MTPTNSVHETAPRSHKGVTPDAFDSIFGEEDELASAKARNAARHKCEQEDKQRTSRMNATHSGNGLRDRGRKRLKPAHLQFITELLKDPSNQGAAYSRVYPNANKNTAYRRANELVNRPDVASEILRQQNVRTAKAQITRAKLESALAEVFMFDFRRLFYPEFMDDGVTPHPKAGEPKAPHHLDAEAARVLDSYEKKVGKYGTAVTLRTTGRLGAAELLVKLKGWVKDDGRPPIVANFNFDFGAKPVPSQVIDVETVPVVLYAAMGLCDASIPARPIPLALDEYGDPVKSSLPPGYEPGRRIRNNRQGRDLRTTM